MDPYDLNIEFTGLCMFAAEPQDGATRGRMHVLFPVHDETDHDTTDDHDTAHAALMHRHAAVLIFNTAYLSEGNTGLATGNAYVRLRDRATAVGAEDASDANLKLCDSIVNLRPVTGTPVDPTLFTTTNDGRIAGRFTLRVGSNTAVAPGKCWAWGTDVRRLAHRVQWTVPALVEPLRLELTKFGGGESEHLKLFPIFDNGRGRLNLFVYHTPLADLPLEPVPLPEPDSEYIPPHFKSFFKLYPLGVPTRDPVYRKGTDECGAETCPVLPPELGRPYDCMGAADYQPSAD